MLYNKTEVIGDAALWRGEGGALHLDGYRAQITCTRIHTLYVQITCRHDPQHKPYHKELATQSDSTMLL